jgi:hypothetical protein
LPFRNTSAYFDVTIFESASPHIAVLAKETEPISDLCRCADIGNLGRVIHAILFERRVPGNHAKPVVDLIAKLQRHVAGVIAGATIVRHGSFGAEASRVIFGLNALIAIPRVKILATGEHAKCKTFGLGAPDRVQLVPKGPKIVGRDFIAIVGVLDRKLSAEAGPQGKLDPAREMGLAFGTLAVAPFKRRCTSDKFEGGCCN